MKERLIPPVDVDEFLFALGVYSAAAEQRGPYVNPASYGLNLQEDDGSATRIQLTDNSESRGALAVREQFPGDVEKYMSLMMRITGLRRLLQDPRMDSFVRETPEGFDLRREVAALVATERCPAERGFNAQQFFRKAKANCRTDS